MRYRIIPVVAAIFSLIAGTAVAQSAPFELGGHFTLAQRQSVSPVLTSGTEPGFGGRLAVHVARAIRVEAEFDVFPRDNADRGWRTAGLFGVVAGRRARNVGIFGKVRGGFIRFSRSVPDQLVPGAASFRATNPAVDFGAVIEAYRGPMTLRFDVGDMVARIGDISCPYLGCTATAWQHSLQINAGVGLRF